MTVWQAVILGIVQGVTEFLPVSSSGHLVIAQQLLGITEHALTFDVMVHAGSLLAIVLALKDELALMWAGFAGLFRGREGDAGGARPAAPEGRRLLGQVVVATLPLVAAGLLFRDLVDEAFSSALVPVVLLFATGALLLYADRAARAGAREAAGWSHALWMGLAQALAVLPGLSRSGVTMSVGMMSGLSRQAAARFSFLMAIPAIAGATVLELRGLLAGQAVSAAGADALIVGAAASAVTSYAAIRLFLRFVRRGRLAPFAYYTWALGLVMLFML